MKLTRLGFLTSLLGGFLGRNLKPLPQPSVPQPELYKTLALQVLSANLSHYNNYITMAKFDEIPPRQGKTIKWYRYQG